LYHSTLGWRVTKKKTQAEIVEAEIADLGSHGLLALALFGDHVVARDLLLVVQALEIVLPWVRIFIERMTSDRKLEASREGSK